MAARRTRAGGLLVLRSEGASLLRRVAGAALMVCLALPTLARADDAATKGRQTMSQWADAVVSLKIVAKMRMSAKGREMQEEEQANEAKATVIDPSGLMVASLSDVDPSRMVEMRMQEDPDFKVEANITDLKIRLADGKEIPAKIVLRDKDLDLAYVRPKEKLPAPLPAVDLSNAAKPQVLDEIVVLGRLGEAVNRAPSASLDRILAIVEKPRTLYVPGITTMMAGLGCPVFTLDGKVVGLLVMRSIPRGAGGSGSPYGDNMPVIIPAADVLEGVKQAAP